MARHRIRGKRPEPRLKLSVHALSGRELAALAALPSWQLRDVLARVPGDVPACRRRRILLGERELVQGGTLKELGADEGSRLSLVLAHRPCILTSGNAMAQLWCAETGEKLQDFPMFGDVREECSAALSRDNEEVATGEPTGFVALWFTANGKSFRTFQAHEEPVRSVSFSPDGQLLLTCDESTAKLWCCKTGEYLRSFTPLAVDAGDLYVASAVFSPDGQQVIAGFGDYGVVFFSVSTGQELLTLTAEAWEVAASPDGRFVLMSSRDTAQLWSINPAKRLLSIHGHRFTITAVAVAPDGQQLATASTDQYAKLWSAATGKMLCKCWHPRAVACVAFSSDGSQLLTAAEDGVARLWAAATGKLLRTFGEPQVHSRAVSATFSHC